MKRGIHLYIIKILLRHSLVITMKITKPFNANNSTDFKELYWQVPTLIDHRRSTTVSLFIILSI